MFLIPTMWRHRASSKSRFPCSAKTVLLGVGSTRPILRRSSQAAVWGTSGSEQPSRADSSSPISRQQAGLHGSGHDVLARDALAVGGYRQNLLPNPAGLRYEDYAEDLDLRCRMADLGAQGRHFITIPEALFFYRKPVGSLSTRMLRSCSSRCGGSRTACPSRRKGAGERTLCRVPGLSTPIERWADWRSDLAAASYKRAASPMQSDTTSAWAFCLPWSQSRRRNSSSRNSRHSRCSHDLNLAARICAPTTG